MSNNQKQQLITEAVALLQHRITELERESVSTPQPQQSPQAVEMLTIKECSECVKGLSAHTIRQLVLQKESKARTSTTKRKAGAGF
jgi:hypothetical protein